MISYSNIEGGWDGEGNFSADPLFCNTDSSDFTLYDNSPCVGTGENGTNMGAFGIGCEAQQSNTDRVILVTENTLTMAYDYNMDIDQQDPWETLSSHNVVELLNLKLQFLR